MCMAPTAAARMLRSSCVTRNALHCGSIARKRTERQSAACVNKRRRSLAPGSLFSRRPARMRRLWASQSSRERNGSPFRRDLGAGERQRGDVVAHFLATRRSFGLRRGLMTPI